MRRDKSNLLPDKWSPQQHPRATQIRQAFAFFGHPANEKVRLQFVPLYHLLLVKINDDANLAPFERPLCYWPNKDGKEKKKNKTRDKIKTIIGSFSQFGATKGIN